MVDWKKELKRIIKKRFESMMGYEIPINNIELIDIDFPVDFSILSIDELAYFYAFDIMKECFEHAEIIKNILLEKNCKVELDINELKKTGVINVYLLPETTIAHINIKLKILPDGLMIDWEKEENK